GNVYVADKYNDAIRTITPNAAVSTLAGGSGGSGSVDGTGLAARFWLPSGVTIDSARNVYVADHQNHTIRRITPDRVVTTFAGTAGNPGSADGSGSAARFYFPTQLAADVADNIYVTDTGNCTVRKITPDGVVTTLAGSPGVRGSTDGVGPAASFYYLQGIAVDQAGNIFVGDSLNYTIRKITPDGIVTTFAGMAGSRGNVDGPRSTARFGGIGGVAADKTGNIYVADTGNNSIRKILPGGTVITLAGFGSGSSDGTGSAARFNFPEGLAVDGKGNLYVGDYYNNTIRKVTPNGVVTTLAGRPTVNGSTDGVGSLALFSRPAAVAIDTNGYLYVADAANNMIRIGGPTALAQSLNISTRVSVQLGENVLIGGFIAAGAAPKRVLLRAIGPSLAKAGLQDALADPVLELRDNKGALIFGNDNWKDSQQAGIEATGLPPTDDRESAIVTDLFSPGQYTAVVRSSDSSTGIALVEVYDLNQTAGPVLANISTRGFVQHGDAVMIGGFILGVASGSTHVLVRAIGPSLSQSGIANALSDPTLELHDGNGALIASNDNWKQTQQAAIQATGIAPSNDLDSAILGTFPPGNYTAIVAGKSGGSGVGLVEVYNLQ
ncbi:MAG: NHL repeat-containing protein, partial [Chthoniobacterales bacterium]